MYRTIKQTTLNEEDIDNALSLLKERIMYKISQKPKYPFTSPKEAFGKLAEENHEALVAMHEENWNEFDSEMLDCAYVCMRYIAGRGKTIKSDQSKQLDFDAVGE